MGKPYQQFGIAKSFVLADIPQVSLSPNADGSALRLVLSSNQIVVPDKLIAQACPFVRDEFLHCVVLLGFILLLRLSARIAYGDNRQAVFGCD